MCSILNWRNLLLTIIPEVVLKRKITLNTVVAAKRIMMEWWNVIIQTVSISGFIMNAWALKTLMISQRNGTVLSVKN